MQSLFIDNETIGLVDEDVKIYIVKQGELEISKSLYQNVTFRPLENFYTHYQDTIRYWTVGKDLVPICINTFKAEIHNHGLHRRDDTVG